MSRRGRLLRLALAVGVCLVLGVLVMPTRLWFGQRTDLAQASAQLKDLKQENQDLRDRVRRLGSATLIEHEAREGFGWVHVRDEAYTVTPAPPMSVSLPDVWPFDRLEKPLQDAAADS